MDVADLFVASTISNQPVLIAGSIIVSASRECVLAGVRIVNEPTRSTQAMTQGSDSAVVRPGHVMVFLIVFSVLVFPG
jgi:hypothetical protein